MMEDEYKDEYKIEACHVSKAFKMYDTPMDKLKEALSLSDKDRHTVFYAVSDLSFRVKKGQILGIMGRNGSGKSTLLKMIAGIYEPTSGTIKVSGRISSLLELGMGFNMEYTGIENIFFYGTLMGIPKSRMEEKLQAVVDFAEIGDYVYQPVKTYSSGMFARLAFSCAVHVEPDILIVDEILSVGDMRFQAKCFRKFKEFKEAGATILYVGHDVSVMRSFCDTAMWIDQGRLVDLGDPVFVSAEYTEYMHVEDFAEFTGYRLKNKEIQKTEKKKKDPKKQSSKIDGSRFPDSIAHWGMFPGLVQSVKMCDQKGDSKRVFSPDETMRIELDFLIGKEIDAQYLSAAFAVKNSEGIDLIVKTTFDENIRFYGSKRWQVSFEFVPRLANGDYYLVIALENRREIPITYYEYIEGACYFKSYTPGNIFGIYDVDTVIKYEAD